MLVFFSAGHSGPARRMESLLAHLERKERHRLSIKRVDVEYEPELAERFDNVKFELYAKAPGYSEGPTWINGDLFFCSGSLMRDVMKPLVSSRSRAV